MSIIFNLSDGTFPTGIDWAWTEIKGENHKYDYWKMEKVTTYLRSHFPVKVPTHQNQYILFSVNVLSCTLIWVLKQTNPAKFCHKDVHKGLYELRIGLNFTC